MRAVSDIVIVSAVLFLPWLIGVFIAARGNGRTPTVGVGIMLTCFVVMLAFAAREWGPIIWFGVGFGLWCVLSWFLFKRLSAS